MKGLTRFAALIVTTTLITTVLPRSVVGAASNELRILSIAWSPDSRDLAVASSLGVSLFEVSSTSRVLWSKRVGWANTVAFDATGKRLAAGLGDDGQTLSGIVEVWRTNDGVNLGSFVANYLSVWALAFSPDGKALTTGGGYTPTRIGGDYRVRVWDTATWQEIPNHKTTHVGVISSVAFSPDGRWLVSAGEDDSLTLEDAQTGRIVSEIHIPFIGNIVFSPDSRLLSFLTGTGLETWQLRSEPEWYLMRQSQLNVSDAIAGPVYSPKGTWFATQSTDDQIHIIDMQDQRDAIPSFPWHGGRALATFSPDGTNLALFATTHSGSLDSQDVSIWSLDETPSLSAVIQVR